MSTTLETPVFPAPQVKVAVSCRRSLVSLALLFIVIYLGAMFSPALLDDADSTHAEAAREMLVRGDYVTLHINGVRYLEKAPMVYWLIAGAYRVFGVNEFSTRLPVTLSIMFLAALALVWGRRAFGDRAGIYGALFVLTAAGYFLFTRIMIPEALFSFLVAAALYNFLGALDDGRTWRWYAGYALVALAVLTKGLLALVIVGLTATAFVLISGDWRRWREFRLGTGLLLLFAIAAPWHILAGIRNDRFFWFYFVNEHVLRFLGRRYPKDYNKLPASLYWTLHLVWLFPWSAYLPVAIRDARKKLFRPTLESRFASRTRLLCWIWAGTVLVFFSFSTNQEYYTFPAYLPLLMLLADAISSEEFRKRASRWLTFSTAATAIAAMVAGSALFAGLWASRHIPYVPDIGTVLNHDLSEDTLSMSHVLDLTGSSLAALRLPALLAAFAFLLGPMTSLWLRARKRHYAATWTMGLTMMVFLIAAHIAFARFQPYLSSRTLAQSIEQKSQPGDRVMIYGDQAFGSSLLFYLKRPIDLVNGRTTSMWFGSNYPDAPKIFLDDNDLKSAWNSPGRVFLFVPPQHQKKVDALLPTDRYTIAESSGKVIYSNRP